MIYPLCIVIAILVVTLPWQIALAAVAAIFFAYLALALLCEMVFMIKYREEYLACSSAVISKCDERVNEVNRSTRHYYVARGFSMHAEGGRLKSGYRYWIADRPRKSDRLMF